MEYLDMNKIRTRLMHGLITFILFGFFAVSFADVTTQIKQIEKNAPENIQLLSVTPEGEGVVISGSTGENKHLATYMRQLDEEVGSPSLEKIKRVDGAGVFTLKIKKLK